MEEALAATLIVLAGCATPPARTPQVTAVSIANTDASNAPSAPPVVNARCKLTTDDWGAQGEGQLRFVHDEQPFAFFGRGRVHLTLGSPVPGIDTRVHDRGVSLEGVTVPADIGLFARRPLLFGELAAPYGGAVLHWTGRTDDTSLILTYRLDEIGDGHVLLKRAVACEDIALERTELDPEKGLIEGASERAFLVQKTVGVATTSSGATVATLSVDDATDEVTVLARKGSRTRIVWPRTNEVILGWVDTAAVQKKRSEDVLDEYFGAGGLGLSGIGGASYWTCPRKLTLYAKRDDRIWEVGSIAANTKVSMGVVNDGYRDVSLYVTHSLRAAQDVTFLVPNKDLSDCSF